MFDQNSTRKEPKNIIIFPELKHHITKQNILNLFSTLKTLSSNMHLQKILTHHISKALLAA